MKRQSCESNSITNDIQQHVAGYHLYLLDFPTDKAIFSNCYRKFNTPTECISEHRNCQRTLLLKYDPNIMVGTETASLIFGTEIWELDLEEDGNFRLESPPRYPLIVFRIQPDFQKGEFAYAADDPDSCPYQAAEIVLFSNWFALYGDVLLHAASIIWNGNGFVFIGRSGAGKSTLVTGLLEVSDVEILGEDQAVLRKINAEYYVFGTPWHVDPNKCSPNGAPLRGIFFLNRFNQIDFIKVDAFDAYMRLVTTSFIPLYREREVVDKVHDRLQEVAQSIPAWEYAYSFDTSSLMEFLSKY